MVLWHSERGSCVKEDLGWQSKIIQRKGKANVTENKKVNTYKLHHINRLNVSMYWLWWRMKAIKLACNAGTRLSNFVLRYLLSCADTSFYLCKEKIGNYVVDLQGLSKDFLHVQTFQWSLKEYGDPWSLFLLWGRLTRWVIVVFRKKNYYSSIVGPPKKSLIAINAGL